MFMTPSCGPSDKPVECVDNVRRRVAAFSGGEVFGWKIWEWYGVMIEAEFHSVWRSPEGALQDVTPNVLPFNQVLFLPDITLQYLERQIENVRKPLISDPRVREFIKGSSEEFALLNDGERADQYEISLSQAERRLLASLQEKKQLLIAHIERTQPGRNELCRCGSGRKYKQCCIDVA
jgi:SEC-C motif